MFPSFSLDGREFGATNVQRDDDRVHVPKRSVPNGFIGVDDCISKRKQDGVEKSKWILGFIFSLFIIESQKVNFTWVYVCLSKKVLEAINFEVFEGVFMGSTGACLT